MFRNEEGVFLPVFCTAGVSSLSDDGSPEAERGGTAEGRGTPHGVGRLLAGGESGFGGLGG